MNIWIESICTDTTIWNVQKTVKDTWDPNNKENDWLIDLIDFVILNVIGYFETCCT